MNATQPSVAFTTITGKASLLVPSPFRSAPGTLPSGRSARTPAYQVVAVVSRPIRPAPASARPATATVPSPVGVTGVSRTTPSPEKSRTSSSLGAPVLVTIRPSTPGSTPVSRIPITTPRPSYVGCLARKSFTPALCRGMRPTSSARAGGRMGSLLATPVAVGGVWDAGGGEVGAGEAGEAGEAAGVGRVVGGGAEPLHRAVSATSRSGMACDLMVDSTARRLRGVGR